MRSDSRLILFDAALDHFNDLMGVRGEHCTRDNMQCRVHHRGANIYLTRIRQDVPPRQQLARYCSNNRCVGLHATDVKGRRHNAAMASPGLSLAGQKAAAEPRLKEPPRELRLSVICSVIEQNMPNTARLVDDEPA